MTQRSDNVKTIDWMDALAVGASYPPLTVVVDVAPNAASPQENRITASGGRALSVTASEVVEIGRGEKPPARRTISRP